MPDDGLTGQLETRRASLVTANRELLSAAAAANNGAGRDLTADEEARYQSARTEIRALGERLDDLADQAAREERARAARAGQEGVADDHGSGARASGLQVTSEPTVYGKYSGNSYWLDLARAELNRGQDVPGARERLGRHAQELSVDLPKRQERRAKLAAERVERLHAGSRHEELALERFLGSGMSIFERRAIDRTDGAGGYFVPPLWLIDEYVPYLRAGRVLADRCHSMPLPAGTDSINLPRITTGTATGAQSADGAAVGSRDLADNYVNALVKTIAGQEDAAMQLLDQSPIGIDQVIFKDLAADHAMQLDGQVLLGSGASGQITGLYPTGVLTANGLAPASLTGTGSAMWVGASSFYQGAGQIMSLISRNRYRPVDAVVTNPAVWFAMATAADGNARPLVVPSVQGPFNALSVLDSAGSEGLVGQILGRPWYVDNNIPLTFGGAVAPSMATLSSGHVAPTDGSGGTTPNLAVYTPFLAGVFDDLLLFEGQIHTRVLQEILSNTLQVRFQIYNYVAFMPNRYQNASNAVVSYGNANSLGTLATALSTGTGGGLVGF